MLVAPTSVLRSPGGEHERPVWQMEFNGEPVDCDYLERIGVALARYGPDRESSHAAKNVSILYYAFHTTKESQSAKRSLIFLRRARSSPWTAAWTIGLISSGVHDSLPANPPMLLS